MVIQAHMEWCLPHVVDSNRESDVVDQANAMAFPIHHLMIERLSIKKMEKKFIGSVRYSGNINRLA